MGNYLECDMYAPVKELFENMGYAVNGEVKGADLTATKAGELVIVELKKSFSLNLVYQAMDRKMKADFVYVAVPRKRRGERSKEFKNMLRLLKELNLGLIIVSMDSPVVFAEIRQLPAYAGKPRKLKKEAIKREISGRTGDYNTGGTTRRKNITAYREASIALACFLEKYPEGIHLKEIKEKTSIKNLESMLSKNFYGWFKRLSRGTYAISEQGLKFLNKKEYGFLVDFYRKLEN
ncbi:MAG: DUF2161 family putative PD-(D/E)XK-type phosphodiesterase [Lachnospiraceae bacterium]|nr:DUF2161 family putative PD-(D/E)XK-type phosphodiesterase [Lachnospiraceae bacterium]